MDRWCKICNQSINNHKTGCFKTLPTSQRIAKLWDFCEQNKLSLTELSYGSAGWCATVTGAEGKGESWKHLEPDDAIMGAINDFKDYG